MGFKVGTTPGLHYIARSPELATTIKKIGYVLTRGVNTIELPLDLPSEVTFTDAKQIRSIAKKQGLELNMHGDLQIALDMPERSDWRDSHERITKSLRSAIYVGATYIDFHACLNIWLELLTYGTGRKMTLSFCDHKGRFISGILKESKKLREWFIKKKIEHYLADIFSRDERIKLGNKVSVDSLNWEKEHTEEVLRQVLNKLRPQLKQIVEIKYQGKISIEELIDDVVEDAQTRGVVPKTGHPEVDAEIRKTMDRVRQEYIVQRSLMEEQAYDDAAREKLAKGDRWYSEEIRGGVTIVEGYLIMANYLFLEKDPMWVAMAAEYKDLMKKYKINYNDPDWFDNTWLEAQKYNDREFKEFFYSVVAAKFLQGHMEAAFKWIEDEFIGKELKKLPDKSPEDKRFKEECIKTARSIIVGIENPEAREPHYAGSHLLWRPKQLYAAVKTSRKESKLSRLMLIVDHEHLATQGVDALLESRADILTKPDFGELTISIHANHPNPMHPHDILEFGDVVLYELILNLVKTGFGKKRTSFLIYERGGGDDPFQKSIDVLRLIAKYVEKETPLKELPAEFFALEGSLVMGGVKRQMQIIEDHKMDPLKDLFEVPEEEWGILSSAAKNKGKAEMFKKGELR